MASSHMGVRVGHELGKKNGQNKGGLQSPVNTSVTTDLKFNQMRRITTYDNLITTKLLDSYDQSQN